MSETRRIAPGPQERACANCSAWRAWDSVSIASNGVFIGHKPTGQCRAAPPTAAPYEDGPAVWPIVSADEWCRAFAPARTGRAEATSIAERPA